MGLFGKKRDKSGSTGSSTEALLALPSGTSVSATDLDHWLRAWSGTAVGAPLPASLVWSGPRAADPDAGEPGSWVYTLTWSEVAGVRSPAPGNADIRLASDLEAAVDLLQWLVELRGVTDESATAGRQAYAESAVSGLARRCDGMVRLPGGAWAGPDDPEATTSVYLARRPEAAEVVAALADLLPGLTEASTGLATWVLEVPDGRGLWLQELDVDDTSGALDPSTVALCALAALRVETMWAVRVEGTDDTADAATRADLAAIARACAGALGGIGVDVDGFPL
jgi:hypothetical protein